MKTNCFSAYLIKAIFIATFAILSPQSVCAAGATSTEINNAIVQEGSVPLTWENDATYPWSIIGGKLCTSNSASVKFYYRSQYPTTVSFKHANNYNSYAQHLYVIVDGEEFYHTDGTSNTKSRLFRLPKGNHTIEIKSVLDNAYNEYRSSLWDVKVEECPGASEAEINEAIVLDGSVPLTWILDNDYPWQIIDGKLTSNHYNYNSKFTLDGTSSIAFKYSSQYPTTVSFKHENNYHSYAQHLYVIVDGEEFYHTDGTSNTKSRLFRLPKGNHTIEIKSVLDNAYNEYRSSLWDVKVEECPGASEAEINEAIVLDGSVPLTWILDNDYPWQIIDGKLESNHYNCSNKFTLNGTSSILFKYSSQYPTTVSFKHKNNYSTVLQHLYIIVDGEEFYHTYGDPYTRSRLFRLPKGNHTIEIKSVLEDAYNEYRSSLWDVKVEAPKVATEEELNSRFILSTTAQCQWENDSIFPLGYYNDILQTSNAHWQNTKSNLKAHINLENPSVISFDWKVGYDDSKHIARFYVDGVLKYTNSKTTSWKTKTIALSAGEHTMHWEYSNTTPGDNYWMQLKNLKISSDWISVETTPGMLGVETLYKVNKLQDVNFLKIKGGMNDADWQIIKQMVNLYGLDLSEADITTFPASFNGNANFGYIVLPETLQEIPDKAFTTCNIHSITIPSSVTKIGNEAFASTNLGFVDFADNSQLTTIGYKAFYATRIEEFVMPNSVIDLLTYQYSKSDGYRSETFSNCSSLQKISFSDALTFLPRYTCGYCTKLSEIHLPTNLVELGAQFMYMGDNLESIELPANLETISKSAFYNVNSLKNISIPESVSYIGDYAFFGTAISNIEFPISVTTIGAQAFRYCPLEAVCLPNKLGTLGQYAFADNSKLKNVVLPSGITNYDYQFSGCANIKSIECLCATPPNVTNDPFDACSKSNVSLKVPQFAIATYKLDPYWYQFDPIIEGEPTDYWKIIGDLKLLNNRRMEGKPDIDLYYGGKLTVKGDAAMPIGKFDIYTSESNPSSFITDCANITADEINTIFSVEANKWYFLTPMVDVDLQQVIVSGTTNYVFRYYDGATRADIGAGTSWKNVSDMKLKAGVGYIFQCDAASTLMFPVSVNFHKNILTTDAVVLPLTPYPSDNNANKGWNYVGNPFPSYFDIYYMDFTAPITVWNGNTYKAYSIADDDFVLRPMQGFFVQKPDAVDNIVLQPSGRQIESTVNRPSKIVTFREASSKYERFIFNIEIVSDTISDATRIVLNEHASADYELECDASKFMSINEDVPQIYSIDNEGNRLAINERPAINGEIPLGVYIPNSNRNYSISANSIDGEAYLYDAEMRITHNFADGEYNFSAEQGINDNRFSIILKVNEPSSVEGIEHNSVVKITAIKGGVEICDALNKAIIVATLDGMMVYSTNATEASIKIPLSNGVYIVNVENQSYKVIVK